MVHYRQDRVHSMVHYRYEIVHMVNYTQDRVHYLLDNKENIVTAHLLIKLNYYFYYLNYLQEEE